MKLIHHYNINQIAIVGLHYRKKNQLISINIGIGYDTPDNSYRRFVAFVFEGTTEQIFYQKNLTKK